MVAHNKVTRWDNKVEQGGEQGGTGTPFPPFPPRRLTGYSRIKATRIKRCRLSLPIKPQEGRAMVALGVSPVSDGRNIKAPEGRPILR